MSYATRPDLVRFKPSRVEGWSDVSEVVIYPDRVEVTTNGRVVTIEFHKIARRNEPTIFSLLKAWLGKRPWPKSVGERDLSEEFGVRFIDWFTDPPLRTYLPPCEGTNEDLKLMMQIVWMMAASIYQLDDLR